MYEISVYVTHAFEIFVHRIHLVMQLVLLHVPEVDITPVLETSGRILRCNVNALRTVEDLRTIKRLPWDGFVCDALSNEGLPPIVLNSIRVGMQDVAGKVLNKHKLIQIGGLPRLRSHPIAMMRAVCEIACCLSGDVGPVEHRKIQKAITAKEQLLTPDLTPQMMREMKKLCHRDLINAMM